MIFPVVVMNFTHVYEDEHFLKSTSFSWIDCTHLTGTDCYCSDSSQDNLRSLIKDFKAEGIHFIDSGNYHYLTKLWTDKIKYPFSLIVFDHHPDMQPSLFENLMSCGCWVRSMLESNPFLQRVCVVGASEKLRIETKGFSNRLIFFGEHSFEKSDNWVEFSKINLPGPVYISVDKDVLSPLYARTNWDQGSLSLNELEKLLRIIIDENQIVGVDICGENEFRCDAMCVDDERINEKTDNELIHFIMDAYKK